MAETSRDGADLGRQSAAPGDPGAGPAERYRAFGEEIDALKERAFARVGPDDLKRVLRLDYFSRAMEVVGRVLIHVSPEPISFFAGVGALWLHKQLQAIEIGHTALHGVYDRIEGVPARLTSKRFSWDVPIDEESWRYGHNVRHHASPNVAGRDPDIHFGKVRITRQTPHSRAHRFQLPFLLGVLSPNFGAMMNLHFTGVADSFWDNGQPERLDFLRDRSPESTRQAWRKALRKFLPYYVKNYVFFPALAGPMFWKVLLGNWLAETMRDLFTAASIFCGHIGPDTASHRPGTKFPSRGQWYAMQVESTNNFTVSRPVSVLCGGLDYQIEHHLFPTLPPRHVRAIAPEVRAICERHGVAYRSDTWGRTLRQAFAYVSTLAKRDGALAVIREAT